MKRNTYESMIWNMRDINIPDVCGGFFPSYTFNDVLGLIFVFSLTSGKG